METKTSDIKLRDGFYHCPDTVDGKPCKAKYNALRYLGRHRVVHGVAGKSNSAVARAKALTKTKGEIVNVTKPVPPNSKARKTEWSAEALSGFVFAHVHADIQNASQGSEDTQSYITQRISEFLHLEVSRKAQRRRTLGMPSGVPTMRG